MSKIGIGILQTGYVPEELSAAYGEYPGMFEKLLGEQNFEFRTFPVLEGRFPDNIREMEGWLITGSRFGAYEDHDWIPPLEDFIREVYVAGIPMVGICFGHQIIAQALGGKVEKFRGLWGVGNSSYQMKDGSTAAIMAMHQDQVIEKPEDAEVIMSSDFCKYAGFVYKNSIITYQPHPEFEHDYTRELIEIRRGDKIPVEQADPALLNHDSPLDSDRIARDIAEFFLQAVKEQAA